MIRLRNSGILSEIMEKTRSLFRQWDGSLTRELNLSQADQGLGLLPKDQHPDATTTAVCGFCSTGCGLKLHLKDGQVTGLTPETNYPVNLGMACPKGWESLAVLNSPNRAVTPMIRNRSGKLKATSWDHALTTFTDQLKQIQSKHGKDSVAFLSTGQIVNEEMALLGALAKFGMGMVHGDGNTRQCMATAVTAYKQSFGFDAPPYNYQDFEESDVIILVGSNLCITQPIMWQRVLRNTHDPKVVVIDPRKTETAMVASMHLPIQPKSDLTFFYGIAHILIENGWIDQRFIDQHTNGFDELCEHVRDYTPAHVAQVSGIDEERLQQLARMIHEGKRVSFWWTMGVNQSHEGVRVAQAIINLALMTANIGRPGTGANSVTGQCNAMGSRLFSNTTNLLGGHEFTNSDHRQKVADVLGIDPDLIPTQNSLAYHEIIEAIDAGKIKGLWVIATNPAHSWINQDSFKAVIDKLDFLVVQDMYVDVEMVKYADLLLPAAAWGEKDGTFINSERRIGLVKKVAKAPGEALSDFNIFQLIAAYWGCGDLFKKWDCPESVFRILTQLTQGQPCDITGIHDYPMIDEQGGIQWPWPANVSGSPETHRRLFEDYHFYHEDKKAKFIVEASRPMPEPADMKYPLVLLTGRGSAAQWHTQTRTAKSSILQKLYPKSPYIELNPSDAKTFGIRHEQMVLVESRRAKIQAKAFVTPTVQAGQAFLPMHYKQVNRLTNPVFDPYSKQPAYKGCAVSVRGIAHWETELDVR